MAHASYHSLKLSGKTSMIAMSLALKEPEKWDLGDVWSHFKEKNVNS